MEKIIDSTLETRMYSVTMRHLSGIQKGIQSLHSTIEYSNIHGNSDAWVKWATKDITKIVLEGNIYSEKGPKELYNIFYFIELMKELGIPYAEFHEPDFSDAFTSVSFILDERYFNPDSVTAFENILYFQNNEKVIQFIQALKSFKLASN